MTDSRMSRFPTRAKSWLRDACLALPVLLASMVAIYTVRAATTIVAPTGPIAGTVTDYASFPNGTNVGTTAVAPIAMIVASTDEQLFYKAYTDYTDMLGTGSPQITYTDSFEYGGYFNPEVCYSYGSGTFTPTAAASGTYSHSCSKAYSGNFMNWATMSRLDMLRYAMYGGWRATPATDDTATNTVITRAIIPNDGHAWVKVYTGTDISSFLPYSGNSVSLCNATTGSLAAAKPTSTGLHIVSGTYTQWASMGGSQCTTGSGDSNRPTSGVSDYVVAVKVCDGVYDKRSMCKTYGSSSIKPTGVLQQFGESDSTQQIQFALMTGSRSYPRSGGMLRKNAALIEGNLGSDGTADHSCTTSSNEVNLPDGTFCTNNNGIIQHLSEISLNTSNNYWDGSSKWLGCDTYGIYNRDPGSNITVNGILDDPGTSSGSSTSPKSYHCGAWGNPVTEMYAEALRYLAGKTTSTSAYTAGLGSDTDVSSMTKNLTWTPPLSNTNYCASCSIVLISSGQITFDSDELPNGLSTIVNHTNYADINAATDEIGTNEGITGTNALVGRVLGYTPDTSSSLAPGTSVATTSDVCQAQRIVKFSLVRGICPDGASMEGSYLLSGLAWQAWVNGIKATSIDDTSHQTKPIRTYSVALSESMPTFEIPTSDGTVTLAPLCQSSNDNPSKAPAETGSLSSYRTCGLLSLQLGQLTSTVSPYYVYGQAFDTTQKKGSFTVIWDDSTWGNDHDLDVTSVVSWCVGAACGTPSDSSKSPSNFCWNTNASAKSAYSSVATATNAACTNGHLTKAIGENQVLVRTEVLTAIAGNDLSLGFSISGTTSGGGIHRAFYRPGNSKYNITDLNLITGQSTYPSTWTAPQVEVFTASSSGAVTTLENPLWYAAKYGGFTYTPASLGMPPATADTLPSSGTNNNWEGSDGNPSNYFLARNPTDLVTGLQKAFQQIANSGTSADDFGSTSSPTSINDYSGNGVSYQVQYFATRNGVNWNGSLQALWSDASGYLQEGGTADSAGNALYADSASYVVSGTDTSSSVSGTLTNYICTSAPTSDSFDPSASSDCKIVSDSNPIVPVWDATTLLNAYYDPSASSYTTIKANIEKQRAYADDAGNSKYIGQRYIFTYLTAAPNGQAAASSTTATAPAAGTLLTGTQTDFVWNTQCDSGSTCPSCTTAGACTPTTTSGFYGAVDPTVTTQRLGNYGLLNEKSPALAKSLLNWVRGEEDTGDWRSRTTTTANASTGAYSTLRLGDIVNSSPAVVSAPDMAFDVNYNDFTYAAFHTRYLNRRQMVYVGANDGMLHAFNGGFYIAATTAVGTTAATPAQIARTLPSGSTTGSPVASAGNDWSLGQEAWAFVPDNLLPHLRWMADKDYTHVFYVDGSPVVSDAKLWSASDSATCLAGTAATSDVDAQGHVCGWGTIMVVPFRLGGGPITVDTIGDSKTASKQTSNSAYVILDITDPEQPPTVLGEITTGTYALGAAAFATHRETDGKVHFLLTIGSGPSDNGGPTGSGTKPIAAPTGNLGVWVYDLQNIVTQSTTPAATFVGTTGNGPANSFAGDMASVDFDLNYSAEGIYFGTVATADTSTTTDPVFTGGLWKVDLTSSGSDKSDPSSWTLKEVYNTGQPVTIRPTMALDTSNRRMIYFGTGRSYTPNDDSGSSAQGVQQQYIYGVSDNSLLSGLPTSGCTTTLFDASSVSVTSSGAITSSSSLPSSATSLANLEGALLAKTTSGCYQYSGWMMALAAGNSAASVQQPSERVIVNQVVYDGILYTTTYTPPNAAQITASGYSDCNPIPVPGTSSEYGLDYLTGTASPSLSSAFGTTSGTVNKSVSLGAGKASAPTVHNGTLSVGIDGTTKTISAAASSSQNGVEISWREETDNQ